VGPGAILWDLVKPPAPPRHTRTATSFRSGRPRIPDRGAGRVDHFRPGVGDSREARAATDRDCACDDHGQGQAGDRRRERFMMRIEQRGRVTLAAIACGTVLYLILLALGLA